MGMTEYEKRMVELEKKKVNLLTGICMELAFMNKSNIEKTFVPKDEILKEAECKEENGKE